MELVVTSIVSLGVLVATLCLGVYLFVVRKYSYWRAHHVPYVKPELPYGNFKEMGKSIHPAHLSQRFYEQHKDVRGGPGFVGLYIFLNPVLLVTDLRLAKRILIEDFHHFPDRGVYFNEKDDPLSAHLFAIEGQRWKDLRAKITPTFTSGRMKAAFPLVLGTAEQFCAFLREQYKPEDVVEVRDLMARFTTDVIGSYAFGLECNSFRDPQNEFRRIGRKHFDTPRNHPLKVFIMKTFRGLANRLGLKLLHDDVAAFFQSVIRETIVHREAHDERRNDFLDLLIRLKNTGSLEGSNEIVGRLSGDEIAAQAFIFFTAGFETSSSAMTYTLYELALNQDLQRKARNCVLEALEKHDGVVSYESSKNMLYLDQCIYETLRKYPPVAILERIVTKPYRIPDTGITLHRGMKIMIPAYAIHHDPDIYPDPGTYDPDRFTPERMARRDPCAYLPFGEGPRICIGLRFGMMQARIGLALLLKHFQVLPCKETDVPLTYSPRAFVLTPVNGVRLRLVKYNAHGASAKVRLKILDAHCCGHVYCRTTWPSGLSKVRDIYQTPIRQRIGIGSRSLIRFRDSAADCKMWIYLLLLAVTAAFWYVRRKYTFWADRGVPYVKPRFPFGNIQGIGRRMHSSQLMTKFYNEMKPTGSRFGGIYFFTNPVALALELDFVKNVLVRDFAHFHDRGVYYNEKDDPISGHLFNIEGSKWTNLRKKLIPTFSSGKMKMMCPTIVSVGGQFRECLERCIAGSDGVVEMKELLARFTTDVIGTCAFGIECNSLNDPNAEFLRMGRKVFEVPKGRILKFFFMATFKDFSRRIHIKGTSEDVSQFFFKVVRETIEYREQNNIERNDFMNLLMQLKNSGQLDGSGEEIGKLSLNEIVAQAFVFFLGGFETSSTTMSYCLYELALNEEIQQRARECVLKAVEKHGGLSYDALMDMPYIDQCINESLRKYPPGANLIRQVSQDYHVPGTDVTFPKGMNVMIPVYAIHHDPENYPDPERYDPDRFAPEACESRKPYSFIPFGEGPRICIAARFGMLEARVGLAVLLMNFSFTRCAKTNVPLHTSHLMLDLYRELKGKHPFGGLFQFTEPVAMIIEPEMIKHVMVRDFRHFYDRGGYANPAHDPLSGHMLNADGEQWSMLRHGSSPIFSTGRLKAFFPEMVQMIDRLREYLDAKLAAEGEMVELKGIIERHNTDIAMRFLLGVEGNNLIAPDGSVHEAIARGTFLLPSVWKLFLMTCYRAVARKMRLKLCSRKLAEVLQRVVGEAINGKKCDERLETGARVDLIEQLLKLPGFDGKSALTLPEMAAQVFLFICAYETNAVITFFCLHELAQSQELQQRARTCVLESLEKYGGVSYEAIAEMPYIDQCINETLRKHPLSINLIRVVTQDYHVPDSSGIVLPKGLNIIVPVYAIHHDPVYYPKPECYDPDRFAPEACKQRTPYTFLPFGVGPKNCIGYRLSKIQLRTMLAMLLSSYEFAVCPKSTQGTQSKAHTVIKPKGDLWLTVKKLNR
uniref:Uncharacterized protein n=1 Tax=Anopheles christyi TaxID=43041 RepID=A0A182K0X7_9DIPT